MRSSMMSLRLACCLMTVSADIIARHVTVVVAVGEEAVVSLRGYSVEGDALKARVTATPETGTLSQLSKVYSKYAYDPKQGSLINKQDEVTGSGNRVFYSRPQYDAERSTGKWGEIRYKVSSNSGTSQEGIVTLVPPSRRLVASAFDRSSEGWLITGNGAQVAARHDASSFGGSLNRFVVATDELISRTSTGVESNSSRWMFQAPSAFAGNHNAAYGGSLQFTLALLAGDEPDKRRNHNLVEVTGGGITLAFPLWALTTTFGGGATNFDLSLVETAGWLKDPKNELLAWSAPTKCDLIAVLSSMTSLKILGDLTDWYESVALDNVALLVPLNGQSQVPICAQSYSGACTCD